MNRRRFLAWLGLAPVATPLAVSALATAPESFVVGIDGASADDVLCAAVCDVQGGFLIPIEFVNEVKAISSL